MRHLLDIQVKRSNRKLNIEVQGEVKAGDSNVSAISMSMEFKALRLERRVPGLADETIGIGVAQKPGGKPRASGAQETGRGELISEGGRPCVCVCVSYRQSQLFNLMIFQPYGGVKAICIQ